MANRRAWERLEQDRSGMARAGWTWPAPMPGRQVRRWHEEVATATNRRHRPYREGSSVFCPANKHVSRSKSAKLSFSCESGITEWSGELMGRFGPTGRGFVEATSSLSLPATHATVPTWEEASVCGSARGMASRLVFARRRTDGVSRSVAKAHPYCPSNLARGIYKSVDVAWHNTC